MAFMDQVFTFEITPEEAGKSLVRVILRRRPDLSSAAVFQALRKRDIKLNGKRPRADQAVSRGDQVSLYGLPERTGKVSRPALYQVVHQTDQLLIVNKQPGLAVSAGPDGEPGLLEQVQADLNWPQACLCHRLDRQTGGLLLLAAHPDLCLDIRRQMQQGAVVKRYACLVRGVPDQGRAMRCHDGSRMLELTGYLEKQAGQSMVYLHNQKQPGDLPVVTRYRVIRIFAQAGPDGSDVAQLEIELVTGRTHQIRAHLAHIGHPLLGDGKYGRNAFNRGLQGAAASRRRQQLWAVTLLFLPTCTGPLAALAGRKIWTDPVFDWPLPAPDQ
jgi:23S rRNA pseudouridine955/2504/2580 synthase